ncbi:hypothetical protein [Nocardia fluminea]|uniref:hypothetical protein n=1 Tax=Nocardia fluminea TaxID=134984 RepID=UPI00343EE4C9
MRVSGRRVAASAIGALSGAILGYSVHRTVGPGVEATSVGHVFGTPAITTAVIAGVVAVIAAWLLTWEHVCYTVVFGTGIAGVAVVAAVNALPAPDEWSEFPVALGIGLGLLIVPAVLLGDAQRFFFGGLVAAVVLGYQLDAVVGGDRYRYGDFPSSTVAAQQPWQVVVAGMTVAALVAGMRWWRGERAEVELSGRSVAFGAAIAVSSGLVVRMWSESGWLPVAAVVLVSAVFAASRRWLSSEQGMALVAMVAATGVLVVAPGLDREPSTVTLAIGVAALIGGAVCGLRVARPTLAVGICAGAGLIATLSQVSETGWVRLVAGAGLLFAVMMTGMSCSPTDPALLAGWSVLPALSTLVARELPMRTDSESVPTVGRWTGDYYPMWTAESPGHLTAVIWTDAPQQSFGVRPDMFVPGLIVTGLCAACAIWLARRSRQAEQTTS